MASTISDNITDVMERIKRAARKAGRDPGEVTLVAVTKTVEIKKIKEAVSAGIRVFGENYVQEAGEKVKKIKDGSVKWHFIGHLQKNKAKTAVEIFDVIESVDTIELAVDLNKRAKEPVEVLLEVNIAKEKTKSGCAPDGVLKFAKAVAELPMLRLTGLMSIPPAGPDPEASRPYFITLRRMAERINKEQAPGVFLRNLSMGTSGDFEVAVEEGATIVRVGTAIFGPRPPR
ncbi:MAG: YggS family pyridoxal phosphate-dependent enzyme [Deltaproteobacteria bacterium]|nr:YggS family pyridoxal phosphate-dependent enzyme [Deltaproteobacteria bacterium]